jgi:hypothetical protein
MLGQAPLPELQPGALPFIQYMYLDHNSFHGSVPSSYGSTLKTLKKLYLEYNEINSLELRPEDFPSLEHLRMDHIQLMGRMPNVLQLKRLVQAVFSHNSLTALPDVWWHNAPINQDRRKTWELLVEVFAPYNRLSGSLPPLVSTPGANGTTSLAADLPFNDFSGSISASLRQAGTNRHGYLIASHSDVV